MSVRHYLICLPHISIAGCIGRFCYNSSQEILPLDCNVHCEPVLLTTTTMPSQTRCSSRRCKRDMCNEKLQSIEEEDDHDDDNDGLSTNCIIYILMGNPTKNSFQ